MIRTFTPHAKKYFLLIFFLVALTVFKASAATPPVITSFSPASGPVGTSVTITGSDFNTTAASNIVFFGSTMAQVTAATATSLTVTVPTGASFQPISVLNGSTQLTGYSAKPFIVTFTGKHSITATDFAAQLNFTTAAQPVNIAAGDLDGDGKPDLVVVNNTANTISILRNTSTSGSITSASFAAKVDITTGNIPYYVAIADLDGDGKPEIAVANNVSNTVSVFYNKSVSGTLTTASFSGKVDFAVGTAPRSLAIGDIDGDGKPDLVVTNTTTNNVSVLMNTTTTGSITAASFAAAVNFATGAGPRGLAIGDLDGDGKPDLAIANFGASTVSVLRNTSTAGSIAASSFATAVDITCGLHPYIVSLGDIDGDGKTDMVAANQGASTISVLRNTATSGAITTGSFAATVDIATPSTPTGVAIGDLDGDGKPDVVTTNQGNASVSVFRNTSTSGTITSSSFASRVTYTVGATPYNCVIQDIDGDGIPDIAAVNNGANNISVLRNIPTPVTQATGVTFSATTATSTTVAWTNGSGVSRAVFISTASTGSPAPVNLTTYTANTAYGSGTQIGTSGWYCIYNGSAATTVNVTNLTAGANYRVMTLEYNGTAGNELYQTATATNNPVNLYNPVIGTTGSLSAMSTTYGTASASQSFSVSGTGMAAGIVITPPVGFELSTDNTTFASTVTVGTSGTISATPVYIRLAALAGAGNYSGNVVLSSSGGASSVNVATVISTVSVAALTITAANQTKSYGAALPSLTLSYSGFVNGDTQSGFTTQPSIGTTATATSPVSGSPYPISVSGAAYPNYTITYVAGALTITPAPLVITASNASKTYGSVNPTLAISYNGFAGTDDATSLTTQPSISTMAVTGSAAGTYPITVSGATSANYSISYVAATLTVDPALLTITADNQAKIYGAVVPTLTVTYSGLVNGDTESNLTTQPSISTAATATSAVSGSPYPITVSGATSSNYTISYVNSALTINPAALTITATSTSKTYGATNPILAITYSGFAGTEDKMSLTTQPVIATTAVAGSGAGSYPISVSGASSSNYAITYVGGTLVVNPVALSITANNQTKVFGAAIPVLTATYSGFVNGDTEADLSAQPMLATTATATSSIAGSPYPITVSGAVSPNYTISYVAGALTVSAATLTITATNATKVYGSANPALSVSYSGFVGTDNENTLSTLPTITVASGSVVGNYAITASGAVLANYNIIYVGGTLSVTPALLTITANDVSKLPGATLTGGAGSTAFITSGLANGETVGTVTITYGTGAAAGDGQGVYNGQVTPSLLTGGNFVASNYNIAYVKGSIVVGASAISTSGTLSTLTTTFGTASGNGTFNVSGSNLSNNITLTAPAGFEISTSASMGFAGNLTLTVNAGTVSGTPVFIRLSATAPAGTYSGDVTLASSGAATVNVATLTSIVNAAALTITANNVSKTYGQAITGGAGSVAFVTGNGLKNGNTIASVTIAYGSGGLGTDGANTYSGSVIASSAVGANGFLASNYNITYTAGNITVNPAALTITVSNNSKTYGSVNPVLGVTYSGFIGADNATSLTTPPTVSTTALSTSPVGAYAITASGAVSANYTITYVPGVLTVSPAALTITATNTSKSYGSTNPAFGVTYSGFAGTDNAASLTTQPTVSTTAITTSPVSTYAITPGGAASPNYTISYVAGTLTVNPVALTVMAVNASKTYGSVNTVLAINYSGFVGADNAASLTTQPTVGTTATTSSPVGTYPITVSGGASANYTFSYSAGTLTVNPAVLSISAVNASKTYGLVNPVLTVSYSGFIGTDNAASLTSQPTVSTTAITNSPVGTYPVTVSGAASANYNISYVAGTLTVNKATLTITATNGSKTYGAANPAFVVTYNGFVGADNATVLSAQPVISTTALATSGAGTYPITVSGATANNYTINNVAGTLTVIPAALTITADNQSKTLGQINPVLTVTYAGFVNGDAPANLTTAPVVSTTANTGSAVGTYPITASGAVAANYAISYVAGTLTIKPQANANLANLVVNSGALSPVFVQGTAAYILTVANTVTAVNVTATTVDPNATVKINGATVLSGAASGSLPLVVGSNIITTIVTAQDGVTKITYTITVTRVPSANANLSFLAISNGTLSPIFGSAITGYTAGVANTVNTIDVTPTLADPTATLIVNGATATNGSAITISGLLAGDNNVTIVVTAQDGITKLTYTIVVHKAAPPEAITATNILSPNGDGKNDSWAIKDILLYPNNTVTVYDRGGRVVFSKKSYTNDWAGSINGSPLAEDTYYYVVDLGIPLSKPFTGFITVLRNRK
jgi:gliding motility-associated-like protein